MKINDEKLQNLNTDESYEDEYYEEDEYYDDEEYEDEEEYDEDEYVEDNSKRNKIIIGSFVALLALAGVGAMFLFGGSPKSTFLERLNTYYLLRRKAPTSRKAWDERSES